MIKNLSLTNFRCYDEHEVPFNEISIIVGKNNAGKSTLIEALRLVSLVSKRILNSSFKSPPDWTNLPHRSIGITPSLGKIEFSTKNIIYQFGTPPAIITATFENNELIKIYLSESGELFAYAKDSKGHFVKSSDAAKKLEQAQINILPQIGPLIEEERVLDVDYVKSRLLSNLVSRHFRNQLSYFNEYYDRFKELSEETWSGLRIVSLIKARKGIQDIDPELQVQEGGFITEIGTMGHGLQMWLQTMWFLARTPTTSTVVLDEPDVYMHADLQRKLFRILKGEFHQIIIATHSLEIMAEVNPANMVIIDRAKAKSKFASDLPNIQNIIYNDIGSIHNLELARIWSGKKFLMVEGKDVSILKRFHDTLFPKSKIPFDNIPNSDIGGWGGWKYAIGSKYALKNAGDQALKIYCLFDSDFHIPPEQGYRKTEAKKQNINLHIWERKEIENYLIVPSAIYRLINKKRKLPKSLTVELIEKKINELIEDCKEEIVDDFASEIAKYYRPANILDDFIDGGDQLKYEAKNFNKLARAYVSRRWTNKVSIAPGKRILKELNKWLSSDFKVSFGIIELASELTKQEMPEELKKIIDSIENNGEF
jgi:energy-coupling factor transporter ATP-binding protein EcfA2